MSRFLRDGEGARGRLSTEAGAVSTVPRRIGGGDVFTPEPDLSFRPCDVKTVGSHAVHVRGLEQPSNLLYHTVKTADEQSILHSLCECRVAPSCNKCHITYLGM